MTCWSCFSFWAVFPCVILALGSKAALDLPRLEPLRKARPLQELLLALGQDGNDARLRKTTSSFLRKEGLLFFGAFGKMRVFPAFFFSLEGSASRGAAAAGGGKEGKGGLSSAP